MKQNRITKVRIGTKYITISPKPDRDIPNGLRVRFNRDGDTVTAWASCDVIRGKSRYAKPCTDDRLVQEAYIQDTHILHNQERNV